MQGDKAADSFGKSNQKRGKVVIIGNEIARKRSFGLSIQYFFAYCAYFIKVMEQLLEVEEKDCKG